MIVVRIKCKKHLCRFDKIITRNTIGRRVQRAERFVRQETQRRTVFDPGPRQGAVARSCRAEIGFEHSDTKRKQAFEDRGASTHDLQGVDGEDQVVEHIEALPGKRITAKKIEPFVGFVPHLVIHELRGCQGGFYLRINFTPTLFELEQCSARLQHPFALAHVLNDISRLYRR